MALRRDWIASPNHSSRSQRPRIIVVHTAEGSRTYQSLGNYFANPNADVSSHTGTDDAAGVIGEYVTRDRSAWTQANYNSASVAVECCGFAAWTRDEWLAHPNMIENTRQWIAEECAANGIPLLRIGASAAQGGGTGVCGHVDLGAGGGGHWDPGSGFPWDLVMAGATVAPVPPPIPPGLNAAVVGIERAGGGYTMVAADGGVFNFESPFHGSAVGTKLNAPIVDIACTDDGYLLAGADGGVFSYDTGWFGSAANERLNQPVVGIASTKRGDGYWLAAADGGIFTFGAAHFLGSLGGQKLNGPVVGICRSGDGYLMAASDGGVFNFGCPFHGSAGGIKLNQPVVGIDALEDGSGYWLVAADGGIFTFGAAHFSGSTGGIKLNWPAVGIAADDDGPGYWIGAADGGLFNFDAPFYGAVVD